MGEFRAKEVQAASSPGPIPGTAINVFREVLEAALISSLVLAATWGINGRRRWTGIGISGGVLGTVVLALVAESVNLLAGGMGQKLMNATILFAAEFMLSWHSLWTRKTFLREGSAVGSVIHIFIECIDHPKGVQFWLM